jgi:hypothetical protein
MLIVDKDIQAQIISQAQIKNIAIFGKKFLSEIEFFSSL